MNKRKGKDLMVTLIESKEKGIYSTTNILARLWRITLFKYQINGRMWHKLMDRYQFRMERDLSSQGRSFMKGNTTRALSVDKLSWNALMKGLAILNFDEIKIQLVLTKAGVTRTISLDVTDTLDDDEEDE